MKKLYYPVMATALAVAFSSCSSPRSEGESVAKAIYAAGNECDKAEKAKYDELIANLDSHNFQSKEDVREKIADIEAEIQNMRSEKQREIDSQRQEYLDKYVGKPEDRREFLAAIETYHETDTPAECDYQSSLQSLNQLIRTLPARLPNSEKIAKDLINHKLKGTPGAYFDDSWGWTVKNGETCDVKILKDSVVGNDYFADAEIIVSNKGGKYKFDVDICYNLSDDEEAWNMEFVRTKKVDMVRTGKYFDCITAKIGDGCFNHFIIKNNSSFDLMVGGKVKDEIYNEWRNFHCPVGAGKETQGGASARVIYANDFKIEFVELE